MQIFYYLHGVSSYNIPKITLTITSGWHNDPQLILRKRSNSAKLNEGTKVDSRNLIFLLSNLNLLNDNEPCPFSIIWTLDYILLILLIVLIPFRSWCNKLGATINCSHCHITVNRQAFVTAASHEILRCVRASGIDPVHAKRIQERLRRSYRADSISRESPGDV